MKRNSTVEFEDVDDKTFVMYIDDEPKCEFTYYEDGLIGVADLNGELFKSDKLAEQYLTIMLEQAHAEIDGELHEIKTKFIK
jgi:hypothetical protein